MLRSLALTAFIALTAGPASAQSAQSAGGTLIDTARDAGTFETFLSAAEVAGLLDALESDGPFTVFAPTDAAFAAFPEGELERLLEPANQDRLTAMLSYHVVPGEIRLADLADGQQLDTVQGDPLPVELRDGRAIVGNATVADPDMAAGNGVLHAIDAVIVLPAR